MPKLASMALALSATLGSAAALAQTLPPLAPQTAAAAIEKKERIARHNPLTCPIYVSRIATQGAWAFVSAGCGKAGEQSLLLAIFHYANGAWNFACSHSTVELMSAAKAEQKCGMTRAQAIGFGFPDRQ